MAVLSIALPVADMSSPAPAVVWHAPSNGAAASNITRVIPMEKVLFMMVPFNVGGCTNKCSGRQKFRSTG